MELLAPAGGFEQLRAAVAFGADAVYLAGEKFGMRARAANFTMEELPCAIALAHDAGVKAYITCNVTVMQDDLSELPSYLESIDEANADALIVGDLGMLALAQKHAPHCRIHVSTQANVANAEAAKLWHALGASRVVCAREMTLADIASMHASLPSDLEVEAFVHGAQCMAVSSRCLISAYLTGRSGNRGACTQPCRWSYTLEEEKRPDVHFPIEEDAGNTYLMNAKDLCMIEHLRELADAGVDSIKIEGRNKKAFYVATVVGAYRRALDLLDSTNSATPPSDAEYARQLEDLKQELSCISHRPYSTGFYFGDPQQAVDFDGYEQETLHIADVLSCKNGIATLKCRNRFEEGAELEVLSPHTETRPLTVRGLHWIPVDKEGKAWEPEPVAIANRAAELYQIDAPYAIEPGSLVRARTYRRSARHA